MCQSISKTHSTWRADFLSPLEVCLRVPEASDVNFDLFGSSFTLTDWLTEWVIDYPISCCWLWLTQVKNPKTRSPVYDLNLLSIWWKEPTFQSKQESKQPSSSRFLSWSRRAPLAPAAQTASAVSMMSCNLHCRAACLSSFFFKTKTRSWSRSRPRFNCMFSS